MKPEVLELVAKLTEKYHLDDTENGMYIDLNGKIVKTIDFSMFHHNKIVMALLEIKRNTIQSIFYHIDITSKEASEEDHNDPYFQQWILEGVNKAAEIMEEILENILSEGFNKIESLTELMNINNTNEMVQFISEMLQIIDIGIYCGLKRLYKYKDNMGQYLFDKGILKLVATAGVNEQEAIENMKEQINKKYKEIIKKLENEFEYEEHNLSNMPTIGNA